MLRMFRRHQRDSERRFTERRARARPRMLQFVSIEASADPIEITSNMAQYAPDLDWQFTDQEGHVHRYNDDGSMSTVEWVQTGDIVFGDEEPVASGEYRCRSCWEPIEPGTKLIRNADTYRQFMPGIVEARANYHDVNTGDRYVVDLTDDECHRLIDARTTTADEYADTTLAVFMVAEREGRAHVAEIRVLPFGYST